MNSQLSYIDGEAVWQGAARLCMRGMHRVLRLRVVPALRRFFLQLALLSVLFCRAAAGRPDQTLVVYMGDGGKEFSGATIEFAEHLASSLFHRSGVSIEWRDQVPPDGLQLYIEQPVVIRLISGIPSDYNPRVMAEALPYEGFHIRVFTDRVNAHDPDLVPYLLGHVLAHEIAHMLEGTGRHSTSGIMKRAWSRSDYKAMQNRAFSFAREDIQLIHDGLAWRRERLSVNGSELSAVPAALTQSVSGRGQRQNTR